MNSTVEHLKHEFVSDDKEKLIVRDILTSTVSRHPWQMKTMKVCKNKVTDQIPGTDIADFAC